MFETNEVATIWLYVEYIIPLVMVLLFMLVVVVGNLKRYFRYKRDVKEHLKSCDSCREMGFDKYHAQGILHGISYYQTRCITSGNIISLEWHGNGLKDNK